MDNYKSIKILSKILKYGLSISALSITMVSRDGIGRQTFGPFGKKPSVLEYEEVRNNPWIPWLTLIASFLWVRIFFALEVSNEFANYDQFGRMRPSVFQEAGVFLESILQVMWPEQGLLLGGYQNDATFLYFYSFFVLICGAIHLGKIEYAYIKRAGNDNIAAATDEYSLGNNVALTWLTRRYASITELSIQWLIAPAMISLCGCVFWFSGLPATALLFLTSSLAIAFQGRTRLLEDRRKIDKGNYEHSAVKKKVKINQVLQKETRKDTAETDDFVEAIDL